MALTLNISSLSVKSRQSTKRQLSKILHFTQNGQDGTGLENRMPVLFLVPNGTQVCLALGLASKGDWSVDIGTYNFLLFVIIRAYANLPDLRANCKWILW